MHPATHSSWSQVSTPCSCLAHPTARSPGPAGDRQAAHCASLCQADRKDASAGTASDPPGCPRQLCCPGRSSVRLQMGEGGGARLGVIASGGPKLHQNTQAASFPSSRVQLPLGSQGREMSSIAPYHLKPSHPPMKRMLGLATSSMPMLVRLRWPPLQHRWCAHALQPHRCAVKLDRRCQ